MPLNKWLVGVTVLHTFAEFYLHLAGGRVLMSNPAYKISSIPPNKCTYPSLPQLAFQHHTSHPWGTRGTEQKSSKNPPKTICIMLMLPTNVITLTQ